MPLKANAASTGWKLRYIKGAPNSENVLSWNRSVTTTQNYITMSATVSGGAEIYVYTSNGIASLFTSTGATSVSSVAYTRIYATAKYVNYGTTTNYSNGTLDY